MTGRTWLEAGSRRARRQPGSRRARLQPDGLAAALALVLLGIGLGAQAPIVNAVVEHRAVSNGLARELQALAQQGRTVWVGYRVPMVRASGFRMNMNGTDTCCGR